MDDLNLNSSLIENACVLFADVSDLEEVEDPIGQDNACQSLVNGWCSVLCHSAKIILLVKILSKCTDFRIVGGERRGGHPRTLSLEPNISY